MDRFGSTALSKVGPEAQRKPGAGDLAPKRKKVVLRTVKSFTWMISMPNSRHKGTRHESLSTQSRPGEEGLQGNGFRRVQDRGRVDSDHLPFVRLGGCGGS